MSASYRPVCLHYICQYTCVICVSMPALYRSVRLRYVCQYTCIIYVSMTALYRSVCLYCICQYACTIHVTTDVHAFYTSHSRSHGWKLAHLPSLQGVGARCSNSDPGPFTLSWMHPLEALGTLWTCKL